MTEPSDVERPKKRAEKKGVSGGFLTKGGGSTERENLPDVRKGKKKI